MTGITASTNFTFSPILGFLLAVVASSILGECLRFSFFVVSQRVLRSVLDDGVSDSGFAGDDFKPPTIGLKSETFESISFFSVSKLEPEFTNGLAEVWSSISGDIDSVRSDERPEKTGEPEAPSAVGRGVLTDDRGGAMTLG